MPHANAPMPARLSPPDPEGAEGPVRRLPNPFQAWFFLLLFLLAALLLGLILWPFWQFLILALLLSGIFRPVYGRLNRHLPAGIASLVTCLLIVLTVFVPFTLGISALSAEAIHLYRYGKDAQVLLKVQQIVQNNLLTAQAQAVLKEIGVNFTPAEATALLAGLGKTAGLYLSNLATAWAANILTFVLQSLMLLMVSFFLLIEIQPLVSFLARLSPLPERQSRLLKSKFMDIAGEILIGKGICGLIQGALGGVFFAALGLRPALLCGVLMGILSFLPVFGIGLLLLPTAAVLLLYGSTGQAFVLMVYYLVVTLVMTSLIEPRFFRNRIRMHDLLILLAIFGGIALFGLSGILYGPLLVTAALTLAELYMDEYRGAQPSPPADPAAGAARPPGPAAPDQPIG